MAVSDLNELETEIDACDPRGRAARGTDLNLTMLEMPHLNERMLFAITRAGAVEGMAVLDTLDAQDFTVSIPKFLPEGPSELAFWADGEPFDVFNSLDDTIKDHQWTRPVCPNGDMTFTHGTPFQDVRGAIAQRARFVFVVPRAITNSMMDGHRVWLTVTELDLDDKTTQVQTRGYYRWAPFVSPDGRAPAPAREVEREFAIQGALGERLGPIDNLSFYDVEFVVDLDDDGETGAGDIICLYRGEQANDPVEWRFAPNARTCRPPPGLTLVER